MHIVSVNVSGVTAVEHDGRTVRTGFFKQPVQGPVSVGALNLVGDDQADRKNHGGEHKAVYAFSVGERAWWADTLRRDDIGAGFFGENLSVEGLDERRLAIGDTLRAGSCLFQITQPRVPCFKFGIAAGVADAPRTFLSRARPGVYLRVLQQGQVQAGDALELDAPEREPGGDIATLYRAAHDATMESGMRRLAMRRALDNPALSQEWFGHLSDRLTRLERDTDV